MSHTVAMTSKTGATGHRWFAAFYDHLSRVEERGALGRLRATLLSDVRGDVLEIGAGTGANFAHYRADARVLALEPDPHMLKRAELRRTPNIELRQAPAERLPCDDASFDVVVSTLVLCTVDDVPAALAEIRRVLRPGGELRFIEHVRSDGVVGRVQDALQPAYGWFAAGCQWNRHTEDALRHAGFALPQLSRTKFGPHMPVIHGTATVDR